MNNVVKWTFKKDVDALSDEDTLRITNRILQDANILQKHDMLGITGAHPPKKYMRAYTRLKNTLNKYNHLLVLKMKQEDYAILVDVYVKPLLAMFEKSLKRNEDDQN